MEMRTRREPPRFRMVTVASVDRVTPFMVRLTVRGDELEGFDAGLPGASVRLLVPPVDGDVVLPLWTGNEFLFDDGSRPPIRTLTPLAFDAPDRALDVLVVLHGAGPLSTWAESVEIGASAAVSGTGRGYEIDASASSFLIAGDESAIPAITTVLPALPVAASVRVIVEVRDPAAKIDLDVNDVRWCVGERGEALADAVLAEPLDPDVRVWAAGEAASMQRIRKHLFDTVGLPRANAVVRGYWKRGRGET